jgi:3-hydroxyacyl-[acyl-carrier-protein] dehydratase
MPPQLLFDISSLDLTQIVCDQDEVRLYNPQRGAMEQLNGIVYADGPLGRIVGYKDIREDEFWVAGHIPGRPLYPGVLMIEAGAQIAGLFTRKFIGWKRFIGFGGVDEGKFRTQVTPPARMYLLAQKLWERHHRVCCAVQGVVDGTVCFECKIIGTEM